MNEKDYTLDEKGVLTIREGVREIDAYAFDSDSKIKKVILPGSVEKIGEMAFSRCRNLSEIEFSEGLREIGFQCFDRTAVETLVFPKSLLRIKEYAFNKCEALTEITFLGKDCAIGSYAFSRSSLRRATFPKRPYPVGDDAFFGCRELEYLECDTLDIGITMDFLNNDYYVVYAYLSFCFSTCTEFSQRLIPVIKSHGELFVVMAYKKRNAEFIITMLENDFAERRVAEECMKKFNYPDVNAALLEYFNKCSSLDEEDKDEYNLN